MHTKISPENPWGHNRYGFAWEHVPAGEGGHLDFGCSNGAFLNMLKPKKTGRLVGVDVSREAIKKGLQQLPDLELIQICEDASLPFDDGAFRSITILDVLEHVYEQTRLLAELNRVLKDGGILVVTVPGRHLFSFLDMGNLKFRFPGLHRWFYCLRHSQQEFEYRYVSNPDGLIGDVSARKRWHEHFSRAKLSKMLVEAGFSVIDFDGTGFFSRVIGNVRYFFQRFRRVHKVLTRLQSLDAGLFESTNLFCVAEKRRNALVSAKA